MLNTTESFGDKEGESEEMEVCEDGKVMMAEYINNNVVENIRDTLKNGGGICRNQNSIGMGWMSQQHMAQP